MKVVVDRELCTGHGRCYTLSPDIYEPDDDGYCQTELRAIPPELEERALLGAMNCPEDAISVMKNEEETL